MEALRRFGGHRGNHRNIRLDERYGQSDDEISGNAGENGYCYDAGGIAQPGRGLSGRTEPGTRGVYVRGNVYGRKAGGGYGE